MALTERYVTRAANKKNLAKIEFSLRGLAHGPEIFRANAAFVAAHFPPRVVCGSNPMNGVISPKRPKPRPLFEKLMHRCACAHNKAE